MSLKTSSRGLKDSSKVEALLAKLPKDAIELLKEGDFYTLPVPAWRTVYMRFMDGYLAASTDKAFFERLGGDSKGFTAGLENAPLKRLMTRGGDAGIGMMDWRFVGWFLIAGYSDSRHSSSDPPEVVALDKQIQARHAKLEATRQKAIFDVMKTIGTQAGAVRVTGDAIKVRGGFYFEADSLAAIVDALVGLSAKTQNEWRSEEQAIDVLRAKRDELRMKASP